MTARTKGDLCRFTTINETSYGVTGTVKRHAGVLSSLETPSEETLDYDQGCGTRQWVNIVKTMESYGWNAEFRCLTGSDWTQWFTYALGSLNGTVSSSLDSFTAVFSVASDEWLQSVGCKVDTLSLSADAVGAPITFSVDTMAKKNTFTSSSLASLSVARPESKPIYYTSQWQRNGTSIPVKSWTLTISNGLVGDPGLDSNGDGLSAGNGSIPNESSNITLDLTVTSTGPTWDLLKQTGVDDDTLTISIDGHIISCTGCWLRSEFPNREQSMYDETLSYIVKTLTVTEE